jgi:hypothetical protein
MIKHRDQLFTFLYHEEAEPTRTPPKGPCAWPSCPESCPRQTASRPDHPPTPSWPVSPKPFDRKARTSPEPPRPSSVNATLIPSLPSCLSSSSLDRREDGKQVLPGGQFKLALDGGIPVYSRIDALRTSRGCTVSKRYDKTAVTSRTGSSHGCSAEDPRQAPGPDGA